MDVNDLSTPQQTIVWEPMASRDAYGKPTYGSPTTYRGRRSFKNVRVAAKGGVPGVDVISASQIWILQPLAIGYEDRVYVQGDTVFPPIVNIMRIPDANGNEVYVKVMLGSANG